MASLRQAVVVEVGQPSDMEKQILESMDIDLVPEGPPRSPWVPWLAHHREILTNSIFRVHGEGDPQYFAFAYACQNPQLVCACRASPVEVVERAVPPNQFWEAEAGMYDHCSAMEWRCSFSDDDLFVGAEDLFVLLGGVSKADGHLHLDGDWVCIADLRRAMPVSVGAACSVATISGSRDVVALRPFEPWMIMLLCGSSSQRATCLISLTRPRLQ